MRTDRVFNGRTQQCLCTAQNQQSNDQCHTDSAACSSRIPASASERTCCDDVRCIPCLCFVQEQQCSGTAIDNIPFHVSGIIVLPSPALHSTSVPVDTDFDAQFQSETSSRRHYRIVYSLLVLFYSFILQRQHVTDDMAF